MRWKEGEVERRGAEGGRGVEGGRERWRGEVERRGVEMVQDMYACKRVCAHECVCVTKGKLGENLMDD